MRTITGTLKSTPLPWLPVMANIAPPNLRFEASGLLLTHLSGELKHAVVGHNEILLMTDVYDHPTHRQLSRSPVWTRLQAEEYDIVEELTSQWQHSVINNEYLIDDPSVPLPGLKNPALSWGEWVLMNQLRNGHCRMTQTLHKWGKKKAPTCNHMTWNWGAPAA